VESTQKVQTAPYASTIANVNSQRNAACKNFLDSNQDCTKAYSPVTSYIKYSSATLFPLIVPARNRQNLKNVNHTFIFYVEIW